MDSAYWDVFPDAEDADISDDDDDDGNGDEADVESSCSPDLAIPCAKCRYRNRLCKRCRDRQRQEQQQQQQQNHAPLRRLRSSSLELACFSEPTTSPALATASRLETTTPEATIPEVMLQQPPTSDDGSESESESALGTTAQKNGLSAAYAPSPSWMSTYSSSTCATTYTTTLERSRRDGDAGWYGDSWLDVRSRGPPYPRLPRTSRRDAGARSGGWGGWGRRSMGSGTAFGWDVWGVESGSYFVLEGARWGEQRVVAAPPGRKRAGEAVAGRGRRQGRRRWAGFGYHHPLPEAAGARPLPLVDPPTPIYMRDVLGMGAGAAPLSAPYVSGAGHARAVYSRAYIRGTGSARGVWGSFAPRDEGVGGLLGVLWREGVWKGVVGCLDGVFGLVRAGGGGGGGSDDVD
ncbi:hypothetical protein CDEST_12786 [Colletotrichum destructivum]|uniref:Zn(2)-C6 fungal-type domain-containing protein n=1 Tax=Colletotrichum destructivum TaxID=34406 RepID=A0AAX4IX15_9PEZI|nr:hypothetical protein CDEST_12786 [Colletotrichum destructivum]